MELKYCHLLRATNMKKVEETFRDIMTKVIHRAQLPVEGINIESTLQTRLVELNILLSDR